MHKLSLSQKIGDVADKNFVTLDENTLVGVAAKVMRDKDISCILVNRHGSSTNDPIGIVTERDMLYRVLAEHKGSFNINLGEIMSSPLITIGGANSSLADAISIMRNKHIRRLAVQKTKGREITFTLMSLIGNIPSQSIELAELQTPKDLTVLGTSIIRCPYCDLTYENKGEITKHIDEAHILCSQL
jgi:signal-transduction protein with cAMP-binding, CBS, and nucleotidyltransferase domain